MGARVRVKVRAGCKLVTLRAVPLPPEGELAGLADGMHGGVATVLLDDGRELLIASRDLEVVT